MTIRAGYFGVCIRFSTQDWTCHKDAASFATIVNTSQDPLDLVSKSMVFRDSIVFSGLVYVRNLRFGTSIYSNESYSFVSVALGAVCILLMAAFPTWREELDSTGEGEDREIKDFPSRNLTRSICAISAATILFALLSSLWQHVAAVAFTTTVQNMAYGSVKSQVGAAAIALGWGSLALYIAAFCAILVLILSLQILDQLTDD